MKTHHSTANTASLLLKHHCVLCGCPGTPLYSQLPDRLFGAVGSWNLAKCSKQMCGLVWVDPQPSPEEIAIAYANYYTHEPGTDAKPISALKRVYLWMKKNYLIDKYGYILEVPSTLPNIFGKLLYLFPLRRNNVDEEIRYLPALPHGRLLDVGCGSGDWLLFMSRLGWQVEGVDFDKDAVNLAKQRGLNVHCGALEGQGFPDGHFDAITLNHVIEHLPDPVSTLAECRRILKPNGILILATPNTSSLGHRIFKKHWRGLEPPRHLFLFCPSSMANLLRLAGFIDNSIQTTNSDYLWKHSLMLYSKESNLGFMSNKALKFATVVFTLLGQLSLMANPETGECLTVRAKKV